MQIINYLIITLLLIPLWAIALPSDRSKPISLSSEKAFFDKNQQKATYLGKVEITQGTSKITGDQATIYLDNKNNITTIHVLSTNQSKRAFYTELLSQKDGQLKAWAQSIYFITKENSIELIGNAELIQNKNSFKGEEIDYNLKTHAISAYGSNQKNGKTNNSKSSNRVNIVIYPKK